MRDQQFYTDRTNSGKTGFSEKFAQSKYVAPAELIGNKMRIHVFIDVASTEIFIDGGKIVMTETFFPNEDFNRLRFFARDGSINLKNIEYYIH